MPTVPFGDPGIASFATDAYTQVRLMSGDTPAFMSLSYPVDAAVDLPAFSVVALDAQGEIVAAVNATTPAIGILMSKTGPAGPNRRAPVARAGRFFAQALVFGVSYNTAALKLAAFNAAPSPTQIVLDSDPNGPAL